MVSVLVVQCVKGKGDFSLRRFNVRTRGKQRQVPARPLQKAHNVKLEKYVKYDEIFEAIEAGNDNGLEAIIKQLIEDYEEEEE